MDFQAEIIRTSQRKLASNDNQYEIVLRSGNPQILDLGKLPSETLVNVSVELSEQKGAINDNDDLGNFSE